MAEHTGTKYHVNFETGDPGICRASQKCPFGIPPGNHRNTPEEVRALFEMTMDDWLFATWKKSGRVMR